jgi:hypothetical protein
MAHKALEGVPSRGVSKDKSCDLTPTKQKMNL